MQIHLLKRTVKVRIDRHIIVVPREKDNMHNYPHGFQGGLQKKNTLLRFSENMKLDLRKNKCKL